MIGNNINQKHVRKIDPRIVKSSQSNKIQRTQAGRDKGSNDLVDSGNWKVRGILEWKKSEGNRHKLASSNLTVPGSPNNWLSQGVSVRQ